MDGRKRKGDRPHIRPSDKVKRCLFGKADNREKEEESRRNEEETLAYLKKMKMKYNYDVVEEKHLNLENTPYSVAIIIETSYEKHSTGDSSSTSVTNVESESLTTTPTKSCLAENDSKSKLSNEPVNATRNGEGNRACDTDNKAFMKVENSQRYSSH